MGLLDQYEKAKRYAQGLLNQVPQNARGLWDEVRTAPQQISEMFQPSYQQKLANALKSPQQVNKQQWLDAGMELAGIAPLGGLVAHTVYHGSPHKFDKFDMSKIGTGEGAQAYGNGLYFAESPKVADEYAGKLSKPIVETSKGYSVDNMDGLSELGQKVLKNMQKNAELAQYQHRAALVGEVLDRVPSSVRNELVGDAEPWNMFNVIDSGYLYKVDIPDEAIPRMLDWDKPLSEQAQHIRDTLPQVGIKARGDAYGWRDTLPMGEAYRQIEADFGNAEQARQAMVELGIPGIRYLDGSSRTAGQGTSNFVLFDDQLPRILEVNGQPTGLLSYADEAKKTQGGLLGKADNAVMVKQPNIKELQKQLAAVEAKYEPLRKRGSYSDAEWDAIGQEAAAIRKQLMEITGDAYGRPKVKAKRPDDKLLNGVYGSPDEVPKAVKEWVQQNSSLLTSDATDAVRWGRISGTLKDERYADEPITLYRAVAHGDEIRPGDWVTTSYEYAQEHLRKSLGGKGTILEETVNGRDVLVSPTGNAEEAIFAPRRYSK